MGIFFSGSDLIDIAVGIEKNGVVFYDSLVESTSDHEIKNIYRYLSDQEKVHMRRFQDMMGKEGAFQPSEKI